MIIDFYDRWVICTPTKTGTTSITALLTKQTRMCGVKHLPVHRPDEDTGISDRIMTVRHPLDRWVSMYWFLRRDKSWGHESAKDGIVSFAREYFRRWDEAEATNDLYFMWQWQQWRFLDRFKPTRLFDLCADNGDGVIDYLNETYGYDLKRMPRLNVTKDREGTFETLNKLPDHLLTRVYEWADQDFIRLRQWGLEYQTL